MFAHVVDEDKDLLDIIGHDAASHKDFCSRFYWEWEEKIATPLLAALGYQYCLRYGRMRFFRATLSVCNSHKFGRRTASFLLRLKINQRKDTLMLTNQQIIERENKKAKKKFVSVSINLRRWLERNWDLVDSREINDIKEICVKLDALERRR